MQTLTVSLAIVILSICPFLTSGIKSYQGYIKYKISTDIPKVYEELRNLENEGQIDVWNYKINPRSIEFLAGPLDLGRVEKIIKRYSIDNVTNRDTSIARRVNQNYRNNNEARISKILSRSKRATTQATMNHNAYLSYQDIMTLLENLHNKYKKVINLTELSRTEENRRIMLVELKNGDNLPAIWIDAGIHGREWIAPASALYFIDVLLSGKSDLSKKYNFFIIPLLNPDGYVFTFKMARLWRKNRHTSKGCVGVDLNRNFPYKWGENGRSRGSCSETNPGDAPGSEKESRAVIDTLKWLNSTGKLTGFFTVHSYGQYILTAFGHKAMTYPMNYFNLILAGRRGAEAVFKEFGSKFTVGSASDLLYEASGGSDDYVTSSYNLNYSYTVELPDTGRHGFVLPPIYINVVGKQFLRLLENILP